MAISPDFGHHGPIGNHRQGQSVLPGPEEAHLVGEHHGLHTVSKSELLKNSPEVRLYGRFSDEKLRRNFRVRESAGDLDENLHLPARESGKDRVAEPVTGSKIREAVGIGIKQPPGDAWRNDGVSVGHRPDCLDKFRRWNIFQQKATRTESQCAECVFVEVKGREDEHP